MLGAQLFLSGQTRAASDVFVRLTDHKADPTLAQARQRVDNFAAGFLAAGARAVIAEAYGGSAARYVGEAAPRDRRRRSGRGG